MSEPKPRVYVAGPINGSGKPHENLRNAIVAAEMLRKVGAIPFVPHLFLQWDMISPHDSQEFWLEMDLEWIKQCHALVRIDGVSPGADREVAFCEEHSIPVFDSRATSGAARPDIYCGVRQFCAALTSGRFDRHRLQYGIDQMEKAKSEEHSRMVGEDELYTGVEQLQTLIGAWIDRQPFRDQAVHQPLLGMNEEYGELLEVVLGTKLLKLNHIHLKAEQKIRGYDDGDKTKRAKLDALGDIFVYMAGYARASQLSLADAIRMAWTTVRARDWNEKAIAAGADATKLEKKQPSPYSEKGHKPEQPAEYQSEEHGD